MPRMSCALPAALLAALPFAAHTAEADSRWLAVQAIHAGVDEDRGTAGDALGATFTWGWALHGGWALETRLSALVLERGDAGGTDFYQQDLGVDALYRFGDSEGWQPFALAGLSAIRNDVEAEDLDGVGLGAHLGGGFISAPLGGLGLRLRADLRYVHDDFDDGMQDWRLGLGVQIPLGGGGRAGGSDSSARETDGDRDGIADDRDRCPHSLPYVKHDTRGCMQPNQTVRLYEVTFDNGTSILTAAAREELSVIVRALREQPDLYVRVDGHTDASGGSAENLRLSQERADAVATWMTLQGVPTQRISTRGFGETRPVESNATAAGRERNRRIELVLLEPPSR